MWKVYTEIELPLVFTLNSMEEWGIRVKGEELKSYGEKLSVRIQELEKMIWEQAGEEFNINSPKQLGVILFEKMGIPGGKKTKTGYSTAADILEKLAPEHEIIKNILEYRQLAKLKSTYADGLSAVIEPDGRIHSTFNQTITATGRISSTERTCRTFRCVWSWDARSGSCLYHARAVCWLTLIIPRLSCVCWRICRMTRTSSRHTGRRRTSTRSRSSQVFHVPLEEVTPQLRRNAKAVNFGIVYGISAFGLSNDLGDFKERGTGLYRQLFCQISKD